MVQETDNSTSGSPGLMVVPAQQKHLDSVTRCHLAAFPADLSSILGRRYVRGLYRFFTEQEDGISLVAVESGTDRVGGVVIGGNPDLRSRYLRRSSLLVVAAMVRAMFTSRYVWWRLFAGGRSALRRIFGKSHLADRPERQQEPKYPPGTWARLRIICTHPDLRQHGAGKALMEAFRAECARRGYVTMRLKVSNDNASAISLYRREGWEPIGRDEMFAYFRRSVQESP